MTFSIMTFRITTLSIKGVLVIFSINDTQHKMLTVFICLVSFKYCIFVVMMIAAMLSVIMLMLWRQQSSQSTTAPHDYKAFNFIIDIVFVT
jgi:hypothetical protein